MNDIVTPNHPKKYVHLCSTQILLLTCSSKLYYPLNAPCSSPCALQFLFYVTDEFLWSFAFHYIYKCAWLLPLNWQITCKQANKVNSRVCRGYKTNIRQLWMCLLDCEGWKWYTRCSSVYTQHENGQFFIADERCWRGLFIYLYVCLLTNG